MYRTIYICREIYKNPSISQRELSKKLFISLGLTNKLINQAIDSGYIYRKEDCLSLTDTGTNLLKEKKVDNAVIIAAGFGSRFVPLTYETPKGLLKVYGERMVERQIKQLHEAGITDITIVVGYLKEKFEYLIDKFDVKLLYNPEFHNKNTLATIYHARKLLYGKNTYILSSDNWIRNNVYNTYEPDSWYCSVHMEGKTKEWCLSSNKKDVITDISIGGRDSFVMYGPVYMSREFSNIFLKELEKYYFTSGTEEYYWENVLMDIINNNPNNISLPNIYINKQPSDNIYEFENLAELREFDEKYNHSSDNFAMSLISSIFNIQESKITDIRCLKSGMTNNSFLFKIENKSYICRIPGTGTDLLINRSNEYDSYMAVKTLNITENIIYFNRENGYKISEFYENSRNSNPHDMDDMEKCMNILRKLHSCKAQVKHDFNIYERIEFYENLCNKNGEIPFEDYSDIKSKMKSLYDILSKLNRTKVLAHIDSVADNFIFTDNDDIKLIDWEYAGMADPIIDVSMASIYSYYDKEEALRLLELYLKSSPDKNELFIFYSYMALGGFLWALWAIYKSGLGEIFGDYTLKMYRYAKDFYKHAMEIYSP